MMFDALILLLLLFLNSMFLLAFIHLLHSISGSRHSSEIKTIQLEMLIINSNKSDTDIEIQSVKIYSNTIIYICQNTDFTKFQQQNKYFYQNN
jgi:hypothetical protein